MQYLIQHKLILILVVVVVLGGAGYAVMGGGAPETATLTTSVPVSGPEAGLVETLLALRAVKLEGTIFTEPAFLQLQDYSTQIVPEPVGRANPFAPLGKGAAPTASSTKGAAIFKAPAGGAR